MKDRRPDAIVMDEKDNVATTLRPLRQGEKALVKTTTNELILAVGENIPPNHKFAIHDISLGEHVLKFGEILGAATENIGRGMHVHTQNLQSLHGRASEENSI